MLPYCHLRGQVIPHRRYLAGQASASGAPWEPVEGQVALLADLRWRRPPGLHRARSDGGVRQGVREADVLSSRVWSGDSCPFPGHPVWWGPGDAPPAETKGSCTQLPPAFRNGVEGQLSSGGWVGSLCRGRPGWLLTSPGKPLWPGAWAGRGPRLVAWLFSWASAPWLHHRSKGLSSSGPMFFVKCV